MQNLGEKVIFFDGGMGTLLQARGLDTLPEIWNIIREDVIFDIHAAYAEAGCDIIKANTFGANRLKLADSGYTPAEIISAGIFVARRAAPGAKIALDIGPTGKLLAPVGELPFEDAIEIFAEMVRAGAAAKADLILIETMSDTYEIKAAMLAAKENANLPVMVTFSPDENGRLLTGADVETAAILAESLGACAVGLNCGFGPLQMEPHLRTLRAAVDVPIIFNPNGGMPKIIDGKTVFDLSPEDFAAQMSAMPKLGASILGGCCGTTPAHLSALIQMKGVKGAVSPCGGLGAAPPRSSRMSSYARTVSLGDELVVIGERINPTGKPRLKNALRENDFDFIRGEALTQVSQGARLLDVNVGLPGIDEAAMLPAAVFAVQSVTDAPLVIDTSDVDAAEAALRVYNGKPLLNSVNGKAESLASVLPLAKKYGAALIALALDDDGIPEDACGRVRIAHKIIDAAEAHGIPRHDIVVDALTMTLSTNVENARITLDAVEALHRDGIATVLGVSNISFGLPARERLNAGFLALALERGLSAAIANPANEALMSAVFVQTALAGKDPDCAGYVSRFATQAAPAEKSRTLTSAVLDGIESDARKTAAALLETSKPLEIINTHLIPALNRAGETFASGETFLPQLLKSAAAATAAFEVIRGKMGSENAAKRGKIILATVHGDIHDIGKNIVRTLLENYNFEVIDLGKNVPPEEVLSAVQAENATLAGLSALMTTTVAAMERTIALLREHAPACKIMVGGAVLTAEHASKIGADYYSPDAMGAVRFAEAMFADSYQSGAAGLMV